MREFLDYFKQKKNLANLLLLGILVLALPLTVQVIRQQQIIKSRAVNDAIIFTGADVVRNSDGTWTSKKTLVSLQLTSPLGPPGKVQDLNLNPPVVSKSVTCLPKATNTGKLFEISWTNPPTPANKVTISTADSSYSKNVAATITKIDTTDGFISSSSAQLSLSPAVEYEVTLTNDDMVSNPTPFSFSACKGSNN